MTWETAFLFTITVLPLICTPGPDILYVISQGLSGRYAGVARAVCGLLLGYSVHAVLSAIGVAAIIVASPVSFEILKWSGVIYLSYLAFQMLKSACTAKVAPSLEKMPAASLLRGFLTSLLNPKGLLMYLAILPHFMTAEKNVVFQALTLSMIFIIGCAIVYAGIGVLTVRAASKRKMTDKSRRGLEAAAGTLLVVAAFKMAS